MNHSDRIMLLCVIIVDCFSLVSLMINPLDIDKVLSAEEVAVLGKAA